MEQGKIISSHGNKLIVQISSPRAPDFQGKLASIGGKKVGKVSEVIGRVDNPCLVIRLFPGMKKDSSSLVGKEILI